MRLAVNAGAVQEETISAGSRNFSNMAFNGSQNFAGRAGVVLETIGARFGPHVNASTSFRQTTAYMYLPSDKPASSTRACRAARLSRRPVVHS